MAGGVPRLYVLPGSHPCAAVEAALDAKGLRVDRVVLLPLAQIAVGPLRYGGTTVPGMRIGRERLVGSRTIMRRLDALQADPPLLPDVGDPLRERVLEAERWGDEVLQSVPRRILDAAFVRQPSTMESYAGDERLPLPRALLRPALPATARAMAIKNRARDQAVREDLAELPAHLDRIDGWIAEGVLGGERANAADLQIGSSIRLLMTLGDVRGMVEQRPAAALVRYFPPVAGAVPAGVLPASWLPAAHPDATAPAGTSAAQQQVP